MGKRKRHREFPERRGRRRRRADEVSLLKSSVGVRGGARARYRRPREARAIGLIKSTTKPPLQRAAEPSEDTPHPHTPDQTTATVRGKRWRVVGTTTTSQPRLRGWPAANAGRNPTGGPEASLYKN